MRETIDRAVDAADLQALVTSLRGAPISEIRYASRKIVLSLDEGESPLDTAESLSSRQEPGARQIGCELSREAYGEAPDGALRLLRRLVDDVEWTVRDAASEVCGRLLRSDFASVLPVLHDWRHDASPNVRRALLIAAIRAAQPRHPERAEPLLKLIEPLLTDRNALVRKAAGPMAVPVLLGAYRDLTFEYLTQWSTSNDPQVLWNVAMAFTTPAAVPIARKAVIVLRKLSLDERRYVWRAVSAALWKLGRRRPDLIRPELARWLEDEARLHVAREALRHL